MYFQCSSDFRRRFKMAAMNGRADAHGRHAEVLANGIQQTACHRKYVGSGDRATVHFRNAVMQLRSFELEMRFA